MEAGFGSTMPRYSEPSAYPRSIEVLGEHGLDLVAVVQRTAGVGHDDFAHVEAFQNFRRGVGHQSDPNSPRLNRIPFDHLNGQMVNGGTRNGDTATALGVDVGAGEHAHFEGWVVGERYPDMAELAGTIDLRRNQLDASGELRRVIPGYSHRRSRIEFQHVDGGYFSIEFDFVVDRNSKHRPGLGRGRRAGDGVDLDDQSGSRRA